MTTRHSAVDLPRRTIGDGRHSFDVSRLCLGAMNFGTRIDEETAFAVLDRFREAGGNFLDTSNNYNQWLGGDTGGQSEALLGRWLASRKIGDDMVVATKAGAHTTVPGDFDRKNYEGLSAPAIRSAVEGSLRRLGRDRIDLYYAHWDDRNVTLDETVGAFAELADAGKTALIGASNLPTWKLERARALSAANGWAPYSCLQQLHTYLWPRPDAMALNAVDDQLVDYVAENPDVTIVCYSPLFAGFYARRLAQPSTATDFVSTWRKLDIAGTPWDHAANRRRLEVLDEVVTETGATPNQVVLAWILSAPTPFVPLTSASSVRQLDEILGAFALTVDPTVRRRLTEAG